MVKTVVFDFDGVINSYRSGWVNPTEIPDPPVEGIKESIEAIRKAGYRVVVVSSRCATMPGILAIQKYLRKYNIEVDNIQKEKPPAYVTIDDRAITFDGHPETLLEKIDSFVPWMKK